MQRELSARSVEFQPLDNRVRIATPERIVFDYPLGGPFRRFGAYLADLGFLIFLVAGLFFLAVTLAGGSSAGMGPALVGYFLLTWGYGVFCEGLLNGQTLGKRLLGLRVMSESGVPITFAQAVVRNLVGTVDGPLPFCYLLGLGSMVLTGRFQRLGDLAAGTMVVIEERKPKVGLVQVREPRVQSLLVLLPVRIAAGPRLSRVLSDYVRRRHRFGAGLRDELAEPLAGPLRQRFGLPPGDADAILCAVYQRVILGN